MSVATDPRFPGPGRPPEEAVSPVRAVIVDEAGTRPGDREAIGEEPVRVVVNGVPAATLMVTPTSLVELALGLLLTEGLAGSIHEIAAITVCREGASGPAGEIRVELTGQTRQPAQERYREVLSSCSLCGLALIEAYAADLDPFARPAGRLHRTDVVRLRDAMSAAQDLFRRTGGAHAAAVAELPVDPARAVVREDIGRHNALDKAVGAAVGQGLRPECSLLVSSGRLSFEMVAKAARAGFSDVAGVSAPSALGIELARRLGMFLAGFARGETMTVYAGVEALVEDR